MMGLKKVIYIFAVVVCCFSVSIFAEDNATPRGFNVNIFNVAPGGEAAFEEVSMKFKAAADKVEGFPPYFGFQSVTGTDSQYAFASPFMSFGEFSDQRNLLAEAYKPAEVQRLLGLIRDSVTSTQTMIMLSRPDLSIPGPDQDEPGAVTVSISITVKPQMGLQFQEYVKKLVEATKATDKDAYWLTLAPGMGAGRVWGVRIAQSWTDLDTPGTQLQQRLVEHFGIAAGTAIFQDGQDAIENIEFNLQRYRADLSHGIAGN